MKTTTLFSAVILVLISVKSQSQPKTTVMQAQDFTTSFTVDKPAKNVFEAVNQPVLWWSEEIVGETSKLNGVFDYHYRDVHICKMKIVEFEPNKKVVWEVLENRFNFIEDQSEWVGTKIEFAISEKDGKTELTLTHHGLTPKDECFKICNDAWTHYIQNSLRNLIVTGKGQPNPKEGGFNEYLLKSKDN